MLPRQATRRYPFRIDSDSTTEERATITEAAGAELTEARPMVERIARSRLRCCDPADVEDAIGDTLVILLERSLPAYDTTQGTNVQAFLCRCATNAITDIGRRMSRATAGLQLDDLDVLPSRDDSVGAIEAMAADIRARLGDILTERQAQILHYMSSHPQARNADIARRFRVSSATVCDVVSCIRKRLLKAAEAN